MARRGRPPSPPRQRSDGTFECWHPGLKRYANLGTTDYTEALRIQQSFYGVAETPAAVYPTVHNRDAQPATSMGGPNTMRIDLDDKPPDAATLVSSWANPSFNATPNPPPSSPPPAPSSGGSPGAAALVKAPPPKKGLTPEQTAKVASGLKKMATNTNIVIVGAAVQMFGRVPAPLDPDEIELLQMGWEMYLDELFARAKLKPVYLVILGNVMIAVSMYASGTPVKKEQPKQVPPAGKGDVLPIKPEAGR